MTQILAVFDMAANLFLKPFFSPTIEAGIRDFGAACSRDEHQFQQFPEDYALYHIGEWDESNGVIHPAEARKVSMAVNFVQAPSIMRDREPTRAGNEPTVLEKLVMDGTEDAASA